MVSDFYPSASLYVSDIRGDILGELDRRFELAGIHPEKVFCTDLEQSLSAQVAYSNLPPGGVDLIIADVPCSGSGTWGRAPEWLRIFDHELIGEYQKRQIRIVSNLTQHLKPGGYLLYITCSVFKAENEEVVEALCAHSDLKLVGSQLISGIETGGDHLFTVLLQI
jgi:16S rRNA (cytosine967-C5)-methyltransferase